MNFKGKKVAVLGAAVEGLSLARFLVKKGAVITICDKKDRLPAETIVKGVEYRLGQNYLNNLTDFEVIFRSPGIPYFTPEIQAAQKAGVEISSQTKLFFDLCPCQIIGVTGTKGKGTTATLIYEILKTCNLPLATCRPNVYLAGNIGTPAIELLEKLKPNDIVVLELSSFQLQDLHKSPHIAVVLNITQDHLDYHKDREEYINAKLPIINYQLPNDFAVINSDYETSRLFGKKTKAQVYEFSRKGEIGRGCYVNQGEIIWKNGNQETLVVKTCNLTLRGEHNWENVCAAACAAILCGANPSEIGKTIASFKGLEHRLEFVAEIEGVRYYNDSFATTPETSIAAIRAFSEPKIVILGGSDKGSDYSELAKEIVNANVKAVILIGAVAGKIKNAILNSELETRSSKLAIVEDCANMAEIIKAAKSISTKGDVVLLSPACASFGMFENYKDRGNQFKEEIKNLSSRSN
jgi:UDP-N-acetylmuramoylalanine--D-glutamate ligase